MLANRGRGGRQVVRACALGCLFGIAVGRCLLGCRALQPGVRPRPRGSRLRPTRSAVLLGQPRRRWSGEQRNCKKAAKKKNLDYVTFFIHDRERKKLHRARMVAVIHSDPRICKRRLLQRFNSTPEQWIEVIKAAVGARARCTEDNAASAPGYYAWEAATARARQMFRREGWDKAVDEGLELIVNHGLKVMIAVMNTDDGTADLDKSPKNRTIKGSATAKVVDLNKQGELFKPHEVSPRAEPPYSLYYLCIFDDGKRVRAELSKPSVYNAGYVIDFSERIFILRDGDWEKVVLSPLDSPADDVVIDVRRKA
jgi:hypothetical protein